MSREPQHDDQKGDKGSKRWRVVGLLGVLFGLLWAIQVGWVWGMTIDDAGITYAYSKHWAMGEGLTYAPGGYRVEGYSNPLWMAMLAPLAWLGVDLNMWAKFLGALFGGAALFGASLVGQRMEGRAHWDWRWRDFVPWAALGLVEWSMWMQAGLENGLYVGLMMLGVYQVVAERDNPGRRPWSVLCAFGLLLTRPDGVMYAVMLGGFKFLVALGDRRQWRSFLVFASWSVGLVGGYVAWHWWYFRDLLPNTYYAKHALGSEVASSFEPGLAYLKGGVEAMGLKYPLMVSVWGLLKLNWDRVLLFGMIAAPGFFAAYSGGDWMPGHRFLTYGVPMLALGVHQGLGVVQGWGQRLFGRENRVWRGLHALGAAGVLAGVLYYGSVQADRAAGWRWKDWDQLGMIVERAQGVKRQAKVHGLEHVSVLTHDFGGMAWEADGAMLPIDYLGLCDPIQARANQWAKGGMHDLAQMMYETYIWGELERSPDFIYLPPTWWKRLETFEEFRRNYLKLGQLDKRVGKEQGKGLFLALSKTAWVHWYPPLANGAAEMQRLGESVTLMGAQRDGETVGLALLKGRGRPEAVALRGVGAEGEPREHLLFGGNGRLRAKWEEGEPYWVELPDVGKEKLEVGVRVSGRWSWYPAVVPRVKAHGVMPREPSFLRGVRDKGLLEREGELLELHRRRRRAKDWRLTSPKLTQALLGDAKRLKGHDAYVAYVWALQSNRELAPKLYREVLKRRTKLGTQDQWTTERELMAKLHKGGDREVAAVAVAWLEAHDLVRKAAWVRQFYGVKETKAWVRQAFDGADFEEGRWGEWRVEGGAFGEGPQESRLDWKSRHPGRHGKWVASSYATRMRDRAVGELESPPFRLSGELLGVLVAGGNGSKVRVELVVEGEVVATARGDRSPSFRRIWWEVEKWRGEVGVLRVVDEERKGWGWIAVDDVILAGVR